MVPAPALVLIQTIDNDIQCDGSDAANLDAFGTAVANALHVIVEASPNSRILLVTQPGRPATGAVSVASHPEAKVLGTGMCDGFNLDGSLNQEHIATLTAIIESYEAEQRRVCATVPQCSTDGGAFAGTVDDITDVVPGDWNHRSVQGHARLAEALWPTVSDLLDLR
jgi:hypothetical protein